MSRTFKLCVNVPKSHANEVREAIGHAGGGQVGHYSFCSFTASGIGRFKANEVANPHIGQSGVLEEVEEDHIEISPIDIKDVKSVVNALIEAHPYEEANYQLIEIYRLEDVL